MGLTEIEKLKVQKLAKEKQVKSFNSDNKKHNGNAKFDNKRTVYQDNSKAVDYYDSLSDSEKAVFNKELEKKKIRDSYVRYLKYIYGENYKLTKFHLLLATIAENVVKRIEKGEKVYICISTPPQHGKLLQDNTPVLTKNGWKNHGDLVVGDYVINHKGQFVKVINVFPKYFANMEVSLTNGEKIKCHENHEWLVYDRRFHKERIIETKEIYNHLLKQPKEKVRGHRYELQLPNKDFIKGEEKELYVNPYVLGVWLGDGKTNSGSICACEKDRITIDECRKYYPIGAEWKHKTTGVIYAGLNKLCVDLHKYGMAYKTCKHNKYIPQDYLTASIKQRLELLAGLIDTDGYVDHKHNRIVFTTADISLRDSFEELIATFGWRTTTCETKPFKSTSGIVGKRTYWQIAFNPTITIPCRIERKVITNFSKQRRISFCNVERIEEEQGNCIEVEGGIYLVGESMIPTHNSTCLTQTLPSWFLGRNPDLRCITTAYNADIAEKFGDEPRQQIKKYGKDLFGIEISDSQDNKTLWNIKNHMGGMYSTGINGSLTSNQGALIIVDDPIKNEIEANNPSIREQIWANFSTSLWTRQRGAGCGIIVIQTRWHEDDLIGRIIANDSDNQWVYINIPCVWESGIDKLLGRKIGETLCPELGFDAKWADNTRKMLGVRRFNALYQGKPIVDGGNIVKREWIKLYNKQSMPNAFDELTLSCDLSFGGKKTDNDPNGVGVWGRVGANHYLIEVINKKCGFTDILERIRYLCAKYPQMKRKIVESKASGNALIDTLNREIGGFVGYDPKMLSKEDRLKLSLPLFESGNVYFPDEDIDKDSEEYITQMVRFPKYTHDEIVDITTQYLLNYEYKYGGRIGTDSKYAILSRAIRGL